MQGTKIDFKVAGMTFQENSIQFYHNFQDIVRSKQFFCLLDSVHIISIHVKKSRQKEDKVLRLSVFDSVFRYSVPHVPTWHGARNSTGDVPSRMCALMQMLQCQMEEMQEKVCKFCFTQGENRK